MTYRLFSSSLVVFGILLTSATAQTSAAQTGKGKTELVRSSLDAGVTQLISKINAAVTASGGDLERQRADWVIAFSTGHYKADPLGAQAAREVATQLVQRQAVSGDQVTARAWEMNVWEYRNPQALTAQIGTDAAADKSRIENLWPTTPAVGSVGGHDTEQAAVTLTQDLNDNSAVLIFLTNTAASVGAAGTRLLGTNAPEYQRMLENWNRVEGSQDGATLNLPYVVKTPRGDIQGQMQAVVFIPKTFTASPLTGGTRAEQLAAPVTETPDKRSGGGGAAIVIGLVLLVLGALAWLLLRGGKGQSGGSGGRGNLRVGDSDFSLGSLPKGKPFCIIAGPGYASDSGVAVIPVQGLPAMPIAELSKLGKDIRVRGVHDDIQLRGVGGKVAVDNSATVPLRLDQPDTVLDFGGEVRGAGGVPRELNRSVTLSYSR